ncbi:MAG: hypothetical protein QW808_02175 [Desulfurococcaceae archaeon]
MSTFTKKAIIEAIAFATIFAVVTLGTSWRLFGQVTVYGDTPYVTRQASRVLIEYFTNVWHSEALGTNQPWPFIHLITIPLLHLSKCYEINIYYAMRVIAIFLSQLSFYFFVREISDKFAVKLLSSILYVINPVFIAYYNMGGTLIHWVLLPIYIKFVYEISSGEKDSINKALQVGLLLSVLFLASPMYLVTYILLSLYPFLSYIQRNGVRGMLKLTLIIIVSLVLTSPYIYVSTQYYERSLNELPSVVLADFKYTYQELSPVKFILLIGNKGSPQPILGYHDSNIYIDCGSVIALFLFLLGTIGMIKRVLIGKTKCEEIFIKYIVITSLTFIVTVMLLRLIVYSDLSMLIERIPLLWTLRNPIKLQTGFALLYPLFIGYGLQELLLLSKGSTKYIKIHCRISATYVRNKVRLPKVDLLKKIKISSILTIILTCVIFIFYPITFNLTAFQGDMGLNQTYKYSLEKLYDRELSCLALNLNNMGDGRGLIVPFDHKVELYVQFHAPNYYVKRLGEPSFAADWLESILSSGDPVLISNALKLFSIDKVILLNGSTTPYFPIFMPRLSIEELTNVLSSSFDMGKVCSYNMFDIKSALPVAYVANGLLYPSNTVAFLMTANDTFFQKKYALLDMRRIGAIVGDGIYKEQYEFTPLLSGLYHFICHNANCYIKIWNSQVAKELELLVNRTAQSVNLSKGKYILEVTYPAITGKLGEGTIILDNKQVQLAMVRGDFHFSASIKIIKEGTFSWESFSLFLRPVRGETSYRIIFHTNGRIEVAIIRGTEYIPSLYVREYGENFSGKNLVIKIDKIKSSLVVDINGTSIHFSLPELSEQVVIEVGSENSVTYLSNASVVSFNNGFPYLLAFTEVHKDLSDEIFILRSKPTKIHVILPKQRERSNEPLIIILNERFTRGWVPNKGRLEHFKANMFFNGFLVEPIGDIITISYATQDMYERLLMLASAAWTFLATYLIITFVLSHFRGENKAQ